MPPPRGVSAAGPLPEPIEEPFWGPPDGSLPKPVDAPYPGRVEGRSPSRSKGSGSTSFPFLYPHSSRIHLVQNFDRPAEHVTFCRAQFCYSGGQPCVPAPSIREQHVAPGRGQCDHTLPSVL